MSFNFNSNIHLQNFLALCASGFYNDCTFHRNIKGFMVQTGDPTGMRYLKHLMLFESECLQKNINLHDMSYLYIFVVLWLSVQALEKVEQVYGVANLRTSLVNT